jgi:antitoxin component YwqK of YwqJK toxin-antitoxin module
MKAGELHGSWEWFRRDGTIKRSGSFTSGRQVGTWITYDDSGQPYKETTFG